MLDQMQQYVGEYFSKEWVFKNVLHMDDDDIEDMKEQIQDETDAGEVNQEPEEDQQDQEPQGTNHTINLKVAK
jgi:hypothetical protein